MTTQIFTKQVLTSSGWQKNVTIDVDNSGIITAISEGNTGADETVDILLPAQSNLHSHSFQRAMAGLAEQRGPSGNDDFWTWRNVMYRFLEILTPDDIQNIAAQVQMEMLEAGYASIGEFHYVHHQHGGTRYDQEEELSIRHFEAAKATGIGYTHLPVFYMRGGLDNRALQGGQLRFGCTIDQFQGLHGKMERHFASLPADFVLGVAPHSLRAVSQEGMNAAIGLAPASPIHIHAAEQVAEIKSVTEALGAPPIRWLLDNMPVDHRWCPIHATHMDNNEIADLARSGAVAGLCPITEANLGDGIFEAKRFVEYGGAFGIGSDSNVKIALAEEFRMLEVSQRLRDLGRVVLSDDKTPSNGRFLYERAAQGGAQALGRNSGRIEVGALADLVALDGTHPSVVALSEDTVLDTWIFACDDDIVSDVWSAGRHVVRNGVHKNRSSIVSNFTKTITRLRQTL